MENGKAMISGFDLCLQQSKPEFKEENSDVHEVGCMEEKYMGTGHYSGWLCPVHFSKCWCD